MNDFTPQPFARFASSVAHDAARYVRSYRSKGYEYDLTLQDATALASWATLRLKTLSKGVAVTREERADHNALNTALHSVRSTAGSWARTLETNPLAVSHAAVRGLIVQLQVVQLAVKNSGEVVY